MDVVQPTDTLVNEAFATLIGDEEYCRLRPMWAKLNPTPDSIHQLTADEMFAIWIYSTPRIYYSLINMELNTGNPLAHVRSISDLIDSGLRKLPVYQGHLYRGVAVSDPELFASTHPVGAEVVWEAFSSCAVREEEALPFKALFVISAKLGRRVTHYSGGFEDEVILRPGTRILIEQSNYFQDQDRCVIVASELTE